MEALWHFKIPEEIQATYQYPALAKELTAKNLNLNSAQLFKVDMDAKLKDVPKDYLSKIKMAYLEEGSNPSHHPT